MKIPPDHLAQLQRRSFDFGCGKMIFPTDKLKALSEYGNWMNALAEGLLQPLTPAQEQFLKVDRLHAEAETVFERAWVRLKGRREFETEQRIAPPPTPKEDYGIVEWDADRWW